jgi:hypothetical protein
METDADTLWPEKPRVLVKGVVYLVLAVRSDGRLVIGRPNGVKTYIARRLPDSPLYGGNRARIEGK